jgi:hypothetical protein
MTHVLETFKIVKVKNKWELHILSNVDTKFSALKMNHFQLIPKETDCETMEENFQILCMKVASTHVCGQLC